MHTLRWARIVGDTTFLSGVAGLVWFTLGLKTGWSVRTSTQPDSSRSGAGAQPDAVTVS